MNYKLLLGLRLRNTLYAVFFANMSLSLSPGKRGKKLQPRWIIYPRAEFDLLLNNNSSLFAFALMMTPQPKASRDLAWDSADSSSSHILRANNRLLLVETGASDMVWEIYLPWGFYGNLFNQPWESWGYCLANMFNLPGS